MGADLIVSVWETGPRNRIDFARARERLKRISDRSLIDAALIATQLNLPDFIHTYLDGYGKAAPEETEVTDDQYRAVAELAYEWAKSGLAALEEMWNGERRDAVIMHLKRSRVLIAGDRTWGDVPFEEYDQIMTATYLDLDVAAGFWK